MRSFRRVLVVPLLVALTVHAEEFSGRVVGVADGDTITVLVGAEPNRNVYAWQESMPRRKGRRLVNGRSRQPAGSFSGER